MDKGCLKESWMAGGKARRERKRADEGDVLEERGLIAGQAALIGRRSCLPAARSWIRCCKLSRENEAKVAEEVK